jgi:hypothetical protein
VVDPKERQLRGRQLYGEGNTFETPPDLIDLAYRLPRKADIGIERLGSLHEEPKGRVGTAFFGAGRRGIRQLEWHETVSRFA